jgi:hypothetical protein
MDFVFEKISQFLDKRSDFNLDIVFHNIWKILIELQACQDIIFAKFIQKYHRFLLRPENIKIYQTNFNNCSESTYNEDYMKALQLILCCKGFLKETHYK